MRTSQSRQCPSRLLPGDPIMLAAPARFATEELLKLAIKTVESAGFLPVIPAGITSRDGQFGGTDEHRATCLNQGFGDPEIRAIWVLRGGYGCGRILPLLDTEAFRRDPKWIVGFSDITALHAWADRQGVASLHAPMAGTYGMTEKAHREEIWSLLKADHSRDGVPVVGGNLSVLYSLLGTPYFPNVSGCWLLLEDLDEFLYHIDRMFLALRLAGVFEKAHGLLLGSFSELQDNTIACGQATDNPFGQDIKAMVSEHFPSEKQVEWGLPIGHGRKNRPVVLGSAWPTFAG